MNIVDRWGQLIVSVIFYLGILGVVAAIPLALSILLFPIALISGVVVWISNNHRQAMRLGILIDVGSGSIDLYGSEASSWGILLNRKKINLKDIRSVRDMSKNVLVTTQNGTSTSSSYGIQISGSFGSLVTRFWAEQPKNEFYDYLVSAGGFGQPISLSGGRGVIT